MEGWIKLYRQVLDNPIVCKDSDHIAVWMYILLNATHKEYPAVFSGKKIIMQPGQLITGRKTIAEKFNIDESKVQRILKRFENEQQIEQQNGNKNRLISVLSWSDYQSSEQQNEQQVNNNCTTTEQQVNTNKNVRTKEGKEKEYMHLEDMPHVNITQEHFDKLIKLLGSEQKVMNKLVSFASWILTQPDKKKKTANPYLTILAWYRRDEEKAATFKQEELKKSSGGRAEEDPEFVPAEVPQMF